jgi:hypothetical protein
MTRMGMHRQFQVIACAGLVALLSACSSKQVVVAKQCPSPYSGHATIRGSYVPGQIYGTSCAPCGSFPIKYDKNGCPIFVTTESCGGPVCLAGYKLFPNEADGGAEDGGQEDGGAQ